MALPLKQSTASQEVPLGHFVDSTDGNTAETGLTIANTDIKLWKSGATTLANKNSGGATHISGGIYYAVLDATDTDTLGPLVAYVHVAGALPVRLECVVLPANTFDSSISGSDKIEVDVTQIGGSNVTAASGIPEVKVASIAADAITATAIASNAITAAKIASDAIANAKIADGAITAAKFAANAITSTVVADNAITAGKIASDAITAAKIADGAIDAATFAAGAITASAIAADAIGASELAADAATEIANAVLSAAASNPIDANVEEINTVAITGDGSGTPFGV